MLLLTMISCVIFQTAVTTYLFNINKTGDGFEKNLTRILVVLLVHLCTKFFLLVLLRDEALYGRVATGFGLAYGPLLYIIMRSIIKKPMPRRLSLAHLVPFFIASVVYVILVAGGVSKTINNNFILNYTANFQWLVVASLLIYSLKVKRDLITYKAFPLFSDPAVSIKWKLINNIATILTVGILVGILFEVTHMFKTTIPYFGLRVLPYAFFAAIPVLILKYKLEQKLTLTPIVAVGLQQQPHQVVGTQPQLAYSAAEIISPAEVGVTKRYEKSSLGETSMDAYQQALNKYMEKNKVYLNAELSLEELALQVKIPKHHLTQLLNDRYKKNFYAYINEYRIQEAIKRLKSVKQDVNILSLAYDCGFNSKSSFNNYFKKVTGHTPTAYRKMVEDSNTNKPLLVG